MRLGVILLALGIAAGASARGRADGPAPPSDQDRLQGLWHYALLGDQALAHPKNLPVLRISGKQVQFLEPGRNVKDTPRSFTFTLDPRQNPKTVDLQGGEGKEKAVYKGIYVLEEGEVRVAFALQYRDKKWQRSTERPTCFDPGKQPKDTMILVWVLEPAKGLPPPSKAEALEALNKHLKAWEMAVNTDFRAVALSPDGKWVAAAGAPSNAVRVWETASGKELADLRGHALRVQSTVFSRDGKRLFTADTAEVRIWELPKGKLLRRIPTGANTNSYQMTLSGDDKWFVSATQREPKIGPGGEFIVATIRLWDVGTGKEVRRFQIVRTTAQVVGQYVDFFVRGKGSDAIMGTAVSQDGKWVAAGTQRGEVHLWSAATGKKVRTFGRSNDFVSVPLGFSKAGKWLATSVYTLADARSIRSDPRKHSLPTVLLWEMATGRVQHAIRGKVFGRGLSEDGQWLITGCEEKTVRIWDVQTGKEVRAFAGHRKPITACSLSRDKKLLATYDRSGTARLWDVATGKELGTVKVKPQSDEVLFSQDAKTLVAWSRSHLTLWDLEKGKEIRSMRR